MKKCILISFWIFQYCLYYLLCHILLFGCLNFSIPSALMGVKQFRSWSGPTLCWVWSGSNLFAKVISRQQKSPLAGKEINTKQFVDTTFWLKPWLKLISFGQLFPFGLSVGYNKSEPGLALNSSKWLKGPGLSCDGKFNHRHVRLPIEVDENEPTLGNIIIVAHLVVLSSVFVWFDA